MARAYAVDSAGGAFKAVEVDLGALGRDDVEIEVSHCGICHSDLSMLNNDWQMTQYPFVPGHEVVGTIVATGEGVGSLKVGQRVGLGWFSGSCRTCHRCMSGDHNLCALRAQTIVGRHGGFAERVRCQKTWAIPLPETLDPAKAGPLFCGGITVFNPIVQFGVRPTDRVGVVGIGGLGHLAIQFLRAWGCHVVAFTSTEGKGEEAMRMGAHEVVGSRDSAAIEKLVDTLDFILVTANAPLAWESFIGALGPKGRLHVVGVPPEPIPAHAFSLISGQKSISGSPLGSPATTATMLDFCARHSIEPVCEMFPMSRVNEAMERLKSGQARYRVVLEADFD